MLDVASGAVADVRMKGGWLPLEQCFVAGVAGDTFHFVNALNSRVASGTSGVEKSVSRRHLTRYYLALPNGAVVSRIPQRGKN